MGAYSDMLDALVAEAASALGVQATRDPSVVGAMVADGGCVFVQFPSHVRRLMAGPNLEVPVSLIAGAPGDIVAMDWLLDHYDDLVKFTGASNILFGPIDVGSETYPSVTATAQIAMEVA